MTEKEIPARGGGWGGDRWRDRGVTGERRWVCKEQQMVTNDGKLW